MAQFALTRPTGPVDQGFVGVSGTAPRSGTVTLSAVVPRVALYVRLGIAADGTSRAEQKITLSRPLPVSIPFLANEEMQVLATNDCTVTFTTVLD